MFETFFESVQGESHKRKNNIPCEDFSYAGESLVRYNDLDYPTAVAIVADGLGGDEYFRSRYGSKLAVETAREEINGFIESTAEKGTGFFDLSVLDRDNKANNNLRRLKEKIIASWRKKVLLHVDANPWTEEERAFCSEKNIVIKNDEDSLMDIYGSTLVAILVTEDYWFALHLGDGGCAVIQSDAVPKMALEEDEGQGFGRVHTLCNGDAIQHFRHNFGFETILSAIAVTDGVTDSYPKKAFLDFPVTILKNLIEAPEESKESKEELKNFLSVISQKGSQDDVSIAVVLNIKESKVALPFVSQIVKLKKENDSLMHDVNEKEEAVKDIEKTLGMQIAKLEKEKNDSSTKIEVLTQEIKKKEEAETSFREQIAKLEREKNTLLTKNDTLNRDLEKEKVAFKDSDSKCKSLEHEISTLKEGNIVSLQDKYNNLLSDNNDLCIKWNALLRDHQELARENSELKEKLEKLNKDLDNKERDLKEKSVGLETLRKTCRAAKADLKKPSSEIDELKKEKPLNANTDLHESDTASEDEMDKQPQLENENEKENENENENEVEQL